MKEPESKLLKIQKRYLSLIFQLNQYQIREVEPPDDLISAIADMERTIKIINKARSR